MKLFGAKRYDQVEGKFWQLDPFDPEKYRSIHKVEEDTQSHTLALDDLQSPDWEQYLTEKPFFALEGKYHLKLSPQTTPTAAEKDKLYSHWQKMEDKYQNKLGELENAIEEIERQKESLTDRVKNFLGSLFTGKSVTFRNQREKIANLKTKSILELDPDAAADLFRQVNHIRESLEKDREEIKDKVEEGKERAEYEKQKEAWGNEKAEKGHLLAQKQSQLEQLTTGFSTQLAAKQKEQKEKILHFCQTYFPQGKEPQDGESRDQAMAREIELGFAPEDWAKERNSISTLYGKFKKMGKKARDKANYLNKLNREAGDIDRMIQQFEKEVDQQKKSLEKELDGLQSEIEHLEEKINRPFKRTNSTDKQKKSKLAGMRGASGGKSRQKGTFVEPLRPQEIPQEALPQVGTLFSAKSERYLAITYWEEYAPAIQEAERLTATVVATTQSS